MAQVQLLTEGFTSDQLKLIDSYVLTLTRMWRAYKLITAWMLVSY